MTVLKKEFHDVIDNVNQLMVYLLFFFALLTISLNLGTPIRCLKPVELSTREFYSGCEFKNCLFLNY
jgi:hypothetical protein